MNNKKKEKKKKKTEKKKEKKGVIPKAALTVGRMHAVGGELRSGLCFCVVLSLVVLSRIAVDSLASGQVEGQRPDRYVHFFAFPLLFTAALLTLLHARVGVKGNLGRMYVSHFSFLFSLIIQGLTVSHLQEEESGRGRKRGADRVRII